LSCQAHLNQLFYYSINAILCSFLYLNHNNAKFTGILASCASGYIFIGAEVPVPWNSAQAEFNPKNLHQTFSKN